MKKDRTNWPVYIDQLRYKAENGEKKIAIRRAARAFIAIGARIRTSVTRISSYGQGIDAANGGRAS